MIKMNTDKNRIKNILKKNKFGLNDNPNRLNIPIYQKNKITAFLKPVSKVLEDNEEYINMLSEWRSTNWQAYPTVFNVTKEGTKKWVKEQLIEREDRILFMVITSDV